MPIAEKAGAAHRLDRAAARTGAAVDHATASLRQVQENKYYADLAGTAPPSSGSGSSPRLRGDGRRRRHLRLDAHASRRRSAAAGSTSPAASYDWDDELERGARAAAPRSSRRRASRPARYDLVIHPSNLWLTIHESIGHATELDRALGYEANYAGTSFATYDKLNTLQYGSAVMNVTGDRTVEHGLATIGYDDEGVQTQSWDIVRDGVLVGYQLDRPMAHMKPELNGGPLQRLRVRRLPRPHPDPADGQRLAAAGRRTGPSTEELIGRVERGLYVVGDKSWSIDMQRFNFQFTGQRFYKIADGELVGQVRDVAYQATTTDFWGCMEAVGGPQTWELGGAFNCGKAQPGQVARGQPRLPDRRCSAASASSTPPTRQATDDHPVDGIDPAVPGRARAGRVDGRRLHRDRPRLHQRQPALGQQHADHQRRDARRAPSRSSRSSRSAGGVAVRLGDRQRQHAGPGRRPGRGRGRRGPGRPPRPRTPTTWCAGARLARLGRRAGAAPTSTSTTPSPRPSARRSAAPPRRAGSSTASSTTRSTTTYLGSTTGLRLRHVQPTGHYGCTGKTADLTQSAWVGGATRDFADVDALRHGGDLAQRLGWGARRVDLPAGRYDTILPPTAVADLMIDAYWYAGARVAHEGQSVYSRRGDGTRIGERHRPRGGHPLLRPGVRRAGSARRSRWPRPRTTSRRSSTTACRWGAPTGSGTASSPRCSRPGTPRR